MNRENETERFRRLCREAATKERSDVMTPERLRKIASYREVDEKLHEFARLSAEQLSGETEREEVAVNRGILSKLAQRKTLAVMTWVILALFGAGLTITLFMGESVIAGKDSTKKTEQVDQVTVIHDTGNGNALEPLSQEALETDWDKVVGQKQFLPQLYIPSYVPESYTFEQLYIEKFDMQYRVEYQFLNESGDPLCINQLALIETDRDAVFFERFDREIESGEEIIYLKRTEDEKVTMATVIRGDGQISIVSSLRDEELKKIFEGLTQ